MVSSRALEALGDELYRACTTRGNIGIKIEDLLNERLATLDIFTAPFSILSWMLWVAAASDNTDVVTFCLGRQAAVCEWHMRAVAGSASFASHKVMIRAKAIDIHYCTDYDGTMLSNATTHNHLPWARFCMEEGADPDRSFVDGYKPVIAAAAEMGFEDMVELFLQFGAKLQGSGAIVLAAAAGQTEMVGWLLAKGADVNEVGVEDYEDRKREYEGTPLHRAARNGHVETAKLLIEAGADLALLDFQGRTPEMLAKQKGQTEILIELQGKGSTQPERLNFDDLTGQMQRHGIAV